MSIWWCLLLLPSESLSLSLSLSFTASQLGLLLSNPGLQLSDSSLLLSGAGLLLGDGLQLSNLGRRILPAQVQSNHVWLG